MTRSSKSRIDSGRFDSVDYIAIAKEEDLSDATNWNGKDPVYILGAAHIEGVRLIDNTHFVS
ncbi:pantoate--beta-alanine ligase [Shewanella algae]|uniref:pantoate--beta-alanine ligase n=1 Tax=Shewanella algae TaxID=38313 RepID=UPI003CC7A9B7